MLAWKHRTSELRSRSASKSDASVTETSRMPAVTVGTGLWLQLSFRSGRVTVSDPQLHPVSPISYSCAHPTDGTGGSMFLRCPSARACVRCATHSRLACRQFLVFLYRSKNSRQWKPSSQQSTNVCYEWFLFWNSVHVWYYWFGKK